MSATNDPPPEAATPAARHDAARVRWLVLALAWVVTMAAAAQWLARDRMPGGYEVPHHLRMTQEIALRRERAQADGSGLWAWIEANRRWYTRPAILHMLCGPVLHPISPESVARTSLLVGGLSLGLLLWAVARLGRVLGDDESALWAVVVVALLPGVWGTVRKYGVDLPLTALVAALAALLADGEVWRRSGRAAAVGVLAGAAALVKAQAIFWVPWLILPTLIAARRDGQTWSALAGRAALMAVGAAVGSALFWAGDLREVFSLAHQHMTTGRDPSDLHAPALSPESFAYYVTACWYWLSPPAMILLALGATLAVARRRAPLLPLIWIAGGYLLFTLIAIKWRRYYFPAMPALVLLGVFGLRQLPVWLGRALLGALVVWLVALLPLASTRWTPALVDIQICHPPRDGNWHTLADQLARATANRPPTVIGVRGPDSWQPDDYRVMEMFLNARWPTAYVCSYCPEDGPESLANYRSEAEVMDLELYVGQPTPVKKGWRWLRVDDLIHAGYRLDDRHPVVALWRVPR